MTFNPYLVQRCSFRKISDEQIEGFDSLLSLDYMGSAEFEFGTIPEALHRICEQSATMVVTRVPKVKNLDGWPLFILSPRALTEDAEGVVTNLFTKKNPYRLKEATYCYEHTHGGSEYMMRTDMWWDVEHDWMACFGDNMRRLVIGLGKVCVKKGMVNGFQAMEKEPVFTIREV